MYCVQFPYPGFRNVPLLNHRLLALLYCCTVGITVLCTNVILLSRSRDSCVQHTADPTSRALDNSNSLFHDNANLGGGGGGGGGMGRRPLDLTSSLRAKPDLIETAEQRGGSRDSNK